MIDVNVGFIVQSYLIYSWTNDTEFFDEIYPFSVRAVKWLIKDSTKGKVINKIRFVNNMYIYSV